MTLMFRACAAAALSTAMIPAPAAANDTGGTLAAPAAGAEIWASSDSEKTSVVKLLGRALWQFDGATDFQGIDIERAWFAPEGQHARKQTRVYLDLGDRIGSQWKWTARIGTNGKTLLGAVSAHSSDWSKEAFVEREIVETPRGLDSGIYYTFAGADADILRTAHDNLNVMAGFQKFTGRNDRLHLRGTFVHVLDSSAGLSVQLRARYFHSTVPGEFDYYSPRDFIQLVPVLQMRRFNRSGWMFLLAAGYGAQKATGTGWQSSRLADLRIESPASSRKFQAFAQVQYANSSLVSAASNYRYVSGRLGLTRRF